nr:MAG TPA: hypothetical protein [Caudoviricetes sp.]
MMKMRNLTILNTVMLMVMSGYLTSLTVENVDM